MGNTSDGFSFHHPPSDCALSWAAALHQRAMLNSGIRVSSLLRVFVGLSFPAEGARGNARVKFVYRVAVGRIAVDDPLLLVVDGVGHVNVAVVRVDRQPVIFRLPVFEERARRELLGSHGHAPDILVDPVQRVARAVELHF